MKKLLLFVFVAVGIIILCSCNQYKEKPKSTITIYQDYKCPHCKQLEDKIIPKLNQEYVKKDKAKFNFINVAFLGEDSIKGARAGHAVQNIAPDKYLDFQKLIFSQQANKFTYELIDKQIDKLELSDNKKRKIKKDYKTKNSESWKDVKEDQKIAKKNNIKEVPSVYINGKKLKNVHSYSEYDEYIKEQD
ncbi:thioredoxin domain-containing protein [Staphylococcus lugdunensis]|uniref:thioredoxin domain-containing protein n=1 Tax=Staphylococcus lugdunensis TaxID=28035 RepID=UPI000A17093F|nr:thioredoxin domain-containing protein [Staphylococcus lugdunensis]ARJ30842.1 protein-disulfide isomerase [Staphylococcus lugdunensis]